MQLLGCWLKAHESVLKVLVVNHRISFLGLLKKNHSKNMATLWTLVNKTNVLLCEVRFPRLHLRALIAEGKNRFMKTRWCIHMIYAFGTLGGYHWLSQPKGTDDIQFEQNAWLAFTGDMTKDITPTKHI